MKNQAGFTLISVLVAMVVLSVGVLSLTQALATVSAAHTEASTRSTALAVARGYMEDVRGRDPRAVTSEPPINVDEQGNVDPIGRFSRSVDVTAISQTLLKFTVTVDYQRARQPVELVTLAYVSGFDGN